MSFQSRDRTHAALSWVVVGILGGVEGFYGRTQYLADWICYLNVSQAVSKCDWRGIFDPMWTPGYPMLVALARSCFPKTAEGEWYAIALLNSLISLAAYGSLRYLVRQTAAFYDSLLIEKASRPAVTWTVCAIFLSLGICFDKVSAVSPDLLVAALFLLSAARLLRTIRQPSGTNAIALGLVLGLGCWVKGIFLSYAAIFLVILFVASFTRKINWRVLAFSTATYLIFFVPYIAAISWSYGQFTLGASGSLNYAFHVNHLPHWTNWQGGPSEFGKPAHHSVQLVDDLPVFAFSGSFADTYPPYNNIAYWYRGFRQFFSVRLQAAAILRSCYFLAGVVADHPMLYAVIFVMPVIAYKSNWRLSMIRMMKAFWPLFFPAILGLSTYMLVSVEDRYVGCFFVTLSLLPLTLLLDPELQEKRTLLVLVVALYAAGAAADFQRSAGKAIKAVLLHEDFHTDSQWRLATALESHGFEAGDPVAVIGSGSAQPNFRCSWAYVARLRIVAEFGSPPWRFAPWERTFFDRAANEEADQDLGQVFWRLPFERRKQIIRAFAGTGARAVVSLSPQVSNSDPGWRPVGASGAWIYCLDPRLAAFFKPPVLRASESVHQAVGR